MPIEFGDGVYKFCFIVIESTAKYFSNYSAPNILKLCIFLLCRFFTKVSSYNLVVFLCVFDTLQSIIAHLLALILTFSPSTESIKFKHHTIRYIRKKSTLKICAIITSSFTETLKINCDHRLY